MRIPFRRVGVLAIVAVAVGLTAFLQGGSVRAFGPAGETQAEARLVEFRDDPLSFEERVRYQRRIEEVYWRHRIWPAENPDAKPTLDEVLPEAVIREHVATYLDKSAALGVFWSRPLTGEQLQAEVNRMVRNTRNAELLRELFAALDDDPLLVAECLARPVLVDRLIRDWYARDKRFHGALRNQAELALATQSNKATRMPDLGGRYVETEWHLAAEDSEAAKLTVEREEQPVIDLGAEEWRERIGRLSASFGIERKPEETDAPSALFERIPLFDFSRLIEENDRFVVTSVLSKEPGRLRTATVTWNKRSFDAWWAEAGQGDVGSTPGAGQSAFLPPSGGYDLPSIIGGGCIADTWTGLFYVPTGRYLHTAVWTGTEMIVWGGYDGTYLNTGGRYDPATDNWTATSTGIGVPAGRERHTAVWSGSEMIVWGGDYYDGGYFYFNTGGKYDPLTDSWSATSMGTDVPTGRVYHTAAWTGTEMIAWGGYDGANSNTGGRYDPATDIWTATSTGNDVPTERYYHATVWTGTEMIVWGGYSSDSGYLQSGGRYEPAADSWTATSAGPGVPTARGEHTAIWSGTEMIVWGGLIYDNGYFYFSTGGKYDPLTDSWAATSTGSGMPTGRKQHTVVWTGTEMIVWGGYDSTSQDTGGRYDPATDSWTATSVGTGVPTARNSHTAVWTGAEMIVWAGRNAYYRNSGARYDPATDSWTATSVGTGVPTARHSHTAVWTGAEMIVWGGADPLRQYTGGRYNPAIDNWTTTSTGIGVPAGRELHTAVWTGSEMIVWGGHDGDQYNTGGRYNPATDSWTATSAGTGVPTERSAHTAIWTGSEMIVWGGRHSIIGGGYVYLDSGGRYDPAADRWATTSTETGVPVARDRHSAIWTGSEMIVWGGTDGARQHTGGRYNPATDSWATTSTGTGVPTARERHTAVWAGSVMIVWGGYDGARLDTGGRYDPPTDSWIATSTGTGVPTERNLHTAVWTGTEMIVWGGSSSGYPSSGGRYEPATDAWAATSERPGVPTGRFFHTTVWTGTEMIVWGGYSSNHLSSGGLYCECEGSMVSTWYPDADGDGYGADSAGIPSCAQPPGYITAGGDCDDTNADTHAGAPEINDGLDNQCPGDDGHGLVDEISGVSGFHNPVDKDEFSWPAQTGATQYEAVRSIDARFLYGCLGIGTEETSFIDSEPVPAGSCHYYLVRSVLPNPGSWGVDSSGAERTAVCQ